MIGGQIFILDTIRESKITQCDKNCIGEVFISLLSIVAETTDNKWLAV